MLSRPCAGPAPGQPCPTRTIVAARPGSKQAARCPPCKAQHERRRQRGTRQQRGYDATHDQIRATLIAIYHPSQPCPRCGYPLGPDPSALDLGHTDDRTSHRGLEHAACNRGNR